jgi:hypothetical protein
MIRMGESSGHTVFREPGVKGMQNILYTVAGGASEVGCGSMPELVGFDGIGEYPIGMGSDFAVLAADFAAYDVGTLREYTRELRLCFDIAVLHLKPHAEEIRRIAKLLVEKRILRSGDVDFSFVEYSTIDKVISGEPDISSE